MKTNHNNANSKSRKKSSDNQNHKPISLTSCLCKIMERMVNDGLVWYQESNGLISRLQCGFRNKRSTTDHLILWKQL